TDNADPYLGDGTLGSLSQKRLSREPVQGLWGCRKPWVDQMHPMPDDRYIRRHRACRSRCPHPSRAAIPAQEQNAMGHFWAYHSETVDQPRDFLLVHPA